MLCHFLETQTHRCRSSHPGYDQAAHTALLAWLLRALGETDEKVLDYVDDIFIKEGLSVYLNLVRT